MTFSMAQLSTESLSREADRGDIYIWSHRRVDEAVCQPVRNLQASVRPTKHPVSQTSVHCEPAASSPESTTAPELCGLNGQSGGTRALGAQWGGYPGIQPFTGGLCAHCWTVQEGTHAAKPTGGLLFWKRSKGSLVFWCSAFLRPSVRAWMSPYLGACPPQGPSPRTRKGLGAFPPMGSKFSFEFLNVFIFLCLSRWQYTQFTAVGFAGYIWGHFTGGLKTSGRWNKGLKRLAIVCQSHWLERRDTPDRSDWTRKSTLKNTGFSPLAYWLLVSEI